ncbi:MAG: fatty acid-binding protein DegV [Chloroflexi bacterium RBG_13_46_14]|nr:MAG: fatty acid-binding protein DegV [Chloroflexi bacterium RBG_13_46_14]
MAVKIITDSLSDITSSLAEELGVTVVPLTVLFGHEQYLDRVTITTDEFYSRLINGNIWPTTTQPTPKTFADVYDELLTETDEILVITVSSKLSGTYQSAVGAISMTEKKGRIEVINSEKVAMGLGLIVITTARKANEGASMDDLVKYVKNAINRSHFVVYFDTLTYLAKGGRIGKAKELMGSVLSIKQILTIKDGEMTPLTRKRSLTAGMDYLYQHVQSFQKIGELAVEHTTAQGEADKLADRVKSLAPDKHIYRSTVSPVLGVYGGPGAIAVTVLEAEK